MLDYILLYIIATVVFFAIDIVWIGVIALPFYRKHIGKLLGDVRWGAAALFYALYIFGLLFFGVVPALVVGSLVQAVLHAGLFGLLAYATYDLTNRATLKHWPLIVVVVDIVWGTLLSAAVAGLTYYLATLFLF
jgi:uncharacterized membrane protein